MFHIPFPVLNPFTLRRWRTMDPDPRITLQSNAEQPPAPRRVEAVVCHTCKLLVEKASAKVVTAGPKYAEDMVRYHYEVFYCPAHKPAYDHVDTGELFAGGGGSVYWRKWVPCDEHGVPKGYATVEPPAKPGVAQPAPARDRRSSGR